MSMIDDVLDRLAGIEIVKEQLRDTGIRVERWVSQAVARDFGVRDIDRVQIPTWARVAAVKRKQRKLH